MSWVKIALFVLFVLLLVPTNGQESSAFFTTVQRTAVDIGNFCERNPDVCENVANSFRRMLQKLKSATDSIEQMLQQAGIGAGSHDTYSDYEDGQGAPTSSLPPTSSTDTLTDTDRHLAWRGPNSM